MIWYLKARRTPALVLIFMACVLGTALLAPFDVPVPDLGAAGGTGPVPAAFLLPAVSATVLYCLFVDQGAGPEARALRPVPWLDRGLAVAFLVIAGMTHSLVYALAGGEMRLGAESATGLQWVAWRNVGGYAGVALLLRPFIGPLAAAVVPVVVAILAGCFGRGMTDNPFFWPLHGAESWPSMAVCALLLGAGLWLGLRMRSLR